MMSSTVCAGQIGDVSSPKKQWISIHVRYQGSPGEANDPTSRPNSKRGPLRANSRNRSDSPVGENNNP